jgi:hypothetical protein
MNSFTCLEKTKLHTYDPVSIQSICSLVNVLKNLIDLSVVPPPETSSPGLWGDQANAFMLPDAARTSRLVARIQFAKPSAYCHSHLMQASHFPETTSARTLPACDFPAFKLSSSCGDRAPRWIGLLSRCIGSSYSMPASQLLQNGHQGTPSLFILT